jgi:hypothetical protein
MQEEIPFSVTTIQKVPGLKACFACSRYKKCSTHVLFGLTPGERNMKKICQIGTNFEFEKMSEDRYLIMIASCEEHLPQQRKLFELCKDGSIDRIKCDMAVYSLTPEQRHLSTERFAWTEWNKNRDFRATSDWNDAVTIFSAEGLVPTEDQIRTRAEELHQKRKASYSLDDWESAVKFMGRFADA